MTLVRLVGFWPDHFSAIKQSLMHASLVRVKERVLTEHLLAERCLLTVHIKFFSRCTAFILEAGPLLSCFRCSWYITSSCDRFVCRACVKVISYLEWSIQAVDTPQRHQYCSRSHHTQCPTHCSLCRFPLSPHLEC